MDQARSIAALSFAASLIASGSAFAQAGVGEVSETLRADTIVATGTRGAGRLASDASAPIAVIAAEQMSELGFGDLPRSLEYLEPSLNYPRAATTATAANSRPMTLRGLSPDQTLVLLNGKRRHATSILNINNTVGRGAAGVDLDLIPVSAIARVEVLKDGAAAQYGSDAIAGVVNIILRDDAGGGAGFFQAGVTEEGDGQSYLVGGWAGFDLPGDGHLTLSAEYRDQEKTNRANVDQRFDRVTYQVGDPDIELASFAANGAVPVWTGELYGFAAYSRKESVNPAGFRVPAYAPDAHPDGFLPKINPVVDDWSLTLGWVGDIGAGWSLDVSGTFGADRAAFSVFETANVSLGADSPTSFYSGAVEYAQSVTDAVLTRPMPDLLAGANLALGMQRRHERYKSEEGEPGAFFGSGADGFAGFSPAFDGSRDAYAGFVDFEINPVEPLFLSGAVRYDDYDDFGAETTWRASARYDVTEYFALRASVGTGFRAPSLQQQQFRLVSGALNSSGELTTVGTLPVADPVAQLLGAQPLRPETSDNVSAGGVLNFGNLSVTVDWFRLEIDDRIVLSEQFGGTAVTNILAANGITNFQQVRFFSNAAATTTQGYEATVRYQAVLPADIALDAALGYAHAQTALDALAPNETLPSLPYLQTRSLILLTEAQPADKATFELELSRGAWSVQTNVSYFGSYMSAGFGNSFVQDFSEKTVVDLSARWDMLDWASLGLGVQNIGDAVPDQPAFNSLAPIIAATGGSFPTGEETPIGLNGRSYVLRLETRF